jgi:hypothetical protein
MLQDKPDLKTCPNTKGHDTTPNPQESAICQHQVLIIIAKQLLPVMTARACQCLTIRHVSPRSHYLNTKCWITGNVSISCLPSCYSLLRRVDITCILQQYISLNPGTQLYSRRAHFFIKENICLLICQNVLKHKYTYHSIAYEEKDLW